MKAPLILLVHWFLEPRSLVALFLGLLLSSCASSKQGGEYASGYANNSNGAPYHPYSQGGPGQYKEYTPPTGNQANMGSCEAQTTDESASETPKKKKRDSASHDVASRDDNDAPPHKKSSKSVKSSKSSGSSHHYVTHVVKSSDTMYALARKYHTTVRAIEKANHRTTDLLRDGEKIKIPRSDRTS